MTSPFHWKQDGRRRYQLNDQQHQNEAACGVSALIAQLGALADQFECHSLSRGIDDIEAAGRAMREAKDTIERMTETLHGIVEADWRRWQELACPNEFVRWAKSRANHALQKPNFSVTP